jgi:hypothetical protein
MKPVAVVLRHFAGVGAGLLAGLLLVCGCSSEATPEAPPKAQVVKADKEVAVAEPKKEPEAQQPLEPKKESEPKKEPEPKKEEPKAEPAAAKPTHVGEPLVDDAKALKQLDPVQPVWIDPVRKQVVFLAETCQANYPLEFFATLRDRGYEACVVMDVKPSLVHAALLAVGAKSGTPVRFEPSYAPPTGTEVQIEVRWKDKDGQIQKAPAQKWIRNVKTKKPMDVSWVFAGSIFRADPEGKGQRYMADSGDFIAVLNLPTATLDIPVESASALESRLYEGFVDNMPPSGTPVTVVMTPKFKDNK